MNIPLRTTDNIDPALRRCYHPVCRVSDLVPDGVTPVQLLGDDWAIARLDGRLVAMIDRCPHRFAPLSAGCVVNGSIQCAYHGYRYGADGRCVEIPALGAGATLPPKATVATAFDVVEKYGLVWLAPDEPLTGIIEVPEWDDPEFTIVPLPDQTWNAGAAQMVDNFLDLAHFPFTHISTFGDPDDREVPAYSVERDGLGFMCDYVHSTKRIADSMGSDQFEVAPRRSTWWYVAPFAIRLRIHYAADGFTLVILFFHQPVDEQTTKLYCFDLRDDIADGRATAEETMKFQIAVAEEDRALLEQLRTKSVPLDLTAEVHTRADRITVEMRRVLLDLVEAAAT